MQDTIAAFNDLAVSRPDLAEESQALLNETLIPRRLHFGGRPLATVLRPHFLTPDEYAYIRQEMKLLLGAFARAYDPDIFFIGNSSRRVAQLRASKANQRRVVPIPKLLRGSTVAQFEPRKPETD